MLGEVDPRTLLNLVPSGWMTLGFSLFAVLVALVGVFLALGERNRDRRGPFLIIAVVNVVALALALGSAYGVICETRSMIIGSLQSTTFDEQEAALEFVEAAFLMTGISIFLVMLLWGLTVFLYVRQFRENLTRRQLFLLYTSMVLLLATATGILVRASAAMHANLTSAVPVFDMLSLDAETAKILVVARIVVIGIALAASIVIVLVEMPEAIQTSRRLSLPKTLLSVAIALVGLVVWLVARPFAHDGAAPLPYPNGAFVEHACPYSLPSGPEGLPRITGARKPCSSMLSARPFPLATMNLGFSGPAVDGHPLQNPAQAFEYVNARRLEIDAPHRAWPHLLIAAPATMSVSDVEPWLAAVANPRQTVLIVLVHDQKDIPSATTGTIQRGPRCSCQEIRIDASGMALSGQTWGKLAKAAIDAPEESLLVINPGISPGSSTPLNGKGGE